MTKTASLAEIPAASFCERCCAIQDLKLLLDDRPPGPKGYSIYRPYLEVFSVDDQWPVFPKLTKAGRDGCRLCQLLLEKLRTSPWRFPDLQKLPRAVVIRFYRSASKKDQSPRIIYSFDASMYSKTKLSDGTELLSKTFFLACCSDCEYLPELLRTGPTVMLILDKASLPFHRAPGKDVFSGQTVNFVKDSIEHCTSNCHPLLSSTSSFMPTRLLDLSEAAATSRVRLIVTADMPSAKYAALSYCWGDAKDAALQSKTTSANLADRMRGSDLNELSPVARDAVKVCMELRIQYLWIDALCILQGKDDIHDWEAESVTMVDVYRNAFLTLCIVATASCQDSFLAPRAIDTGIFVPIPGEDVPGRGYELIPFRETNDRSGGAYDGLITDSNWFQRGWVWQEMNFSQRLLIFSQGLVFFECGEARHCENGNSQHGQQSILASPSRDILLNEPLRFFQMSVEVFSQKLLSFESDRLAAISGLGKEIAKRTGSKYVAGLWAENLHKDLLFERKTRGPALERAQSLRELPKDGPSWAWPAHPGGVKWSAQLWNTSSSPGRQDSWRLECSDGIDFETTLAGSSIFGRVTEGVLKLRTKAVSLRRLAANLRDTYPLLKDEDRNQNALVVKMLSAYSGELTRVASFRFSWDTTNPEIGVRQPKKLRDIAENVLLVLVSSVHWLRSKERDGYGLLVQRHENHGKYVRVGTFDSEAPSSRRKEGYTGGLPVIREWETMSIEII